MAKAKSHPRKKKTAPGKTRKWSAGITKRSEGYERGRTVAKQVRRSSQRSNALDLDKGIFTEHDPKKIARSLENSAEKSTRKKALKELKPH